MARRDSNPDPLDTQNSGSRTTTLESTDTLGSTGLSGTSSGLGVSGTSGAYGTSGTGANPNNWQRAGQENLGSGQSAATQMKEEAKGLASEAKQEVLGVASQAKDHVQNLVGERKDRAAEQLGGFAGSLREAARKLEDGEGGATALGRYAQTAADQVDRVSQYLKARDLTTFVRDAETFARRHPDVFLGGTFIAGLILARFFKASERRHQDDLAEDWQTVSYNESAGVYGSSPSGAYGTSYGNTAYGNTGYGNTATGNTAYGNTATGNTAYGNTYNNTSTAGRTGSASGEESADKAWTPGGPVPPVGG